MKAIAVVACLCLLVVAATATELKLSREDSIELAEIEESIRVASSANARAEAMAARESFFFGKKDQTKNLEEAVSKLKSLSAADKPYNKIHFVWRAFISTKMPGGFWLDEHCKKAGAPALPDTHEYVGRSPRIANPLGNECFRTDSREYSTADMARSRLNHPVRISSTGVNVLPPYSDETLFYVCEPPNVLKKWRKQCGAVFCKKRSPSTAVHTENLNCYKGSAWTKNCAGVKDPEIVFFTLRGTPGDPCTPPGTPKIDYYAKVSIFPKKRHVTVDGKTDDYPWLEVVISADGVGKHVAKVDPKGKSPWSLYGGASNPVVGDIDF